MSLNSIRLSQEILERLYTNTLNTTDASSPVHVAQLEISHATIILVKEEASRELLKEDFVFLNSVLTACSQSVDSVKIFNLAFDKKEALQFLASVTTPKIILFGIDISEIGSNEKVKNYSVNRTSNSTILVVPSLGYVRSHLAEKKKLWNSLKEFFNLD